MFSFLKRKKLWLGFLILVLMIILMRYTALERQDISPFEKIVRDTYTPLQSGAEEIRDLFAKFGWIMANKKNLAEENQRLNRELSEVKQHNQIMLEYKYENERLRQMLDFRENAQNKQSLQSAEVIARSPELWYKTLTINRGERDGIARNMVVITPDGLVGRIISTSTRTAEVLLASDRESAVGVLIQDNRVQGLVEGMGDQSSLRMVNIPYDAEVKSGQVVVTSGLSEIFPKAIRVGKVTRVDSASNGLLKHAIIEPAVNFDRLEEVFIVTN